MVNIGLDLHTIGRMKTGNETYIQNLAEQFSQLDQKEAEFFFYHTADDLEDSKRGLRGQIRRVWPHNPLVRIPISFPYMLLRDSIDVAHFQYVAPPVCPCPTMVTIHDISFEFFPEYFKPAERRRMKMLIPYSARKASHIITISEFSKRQMIETYGLAEDKISVTYLGVSNRFKQTRNPEVLERILSRFKIRRPYLLGVGNIQPRKNLKRLIAVYARLLKEDQIDHELVLVGNPAWKSSEIKHAMVDHGLQDRVHFTGYVTEDELVALYNLAHIFVYPSLYEGFGLPVLEAMACGTPVVTSNVSSIPEVAGDAALLVDPQSDSEIKNAIIKLVNNPEFYYTIVQKGIQQANRFAWEETAKQTFGLYNRVSQNR